MQTILEYDGTFAGWLSAVFEVYERRLSDAGISKQGVTQADAFASTICIATDETKARRVWDGLSKKLSAEGCTNIYHAFLSENQGIENILLEVCRYAFASTVNIETDYGHPAVIKTAQTARKVWREKHRMEAFVRFRQLKDGLFYATVEPDHNVLPLILPHFKSRYADQSWLIYDIRRKYGIYYDVLTGQVREIMLEWQENTDSDKNIFVEEEELYQLLWKDYFKHTGISGRKNLRLHIQHVPRRYWKYLTEKR